MSALAMDETNMPSSFIDMTQDVIRAEREKESMTDAFTAMTLKRRSNPAPKFMDMMTSLAKEDSIPMSFVDMTQSVIRAEREKESMTDAFTAMTLKRRTTDKSMDEIMQLFDQGLPHAMAMLAVKEYEAKQVVNHQKEVTFLNDALPPDSASEPFSWTAMKAAHKYLTN